MAKYTIFLLLLLAFSTNAQQTIEEELLIFVQPEQQSEFTKNNLKSLEALLKEQGIRVRQVDVSKVGAPKEVGFTPFLVYRNHLGRKVYKGRYTTHQRLLNFIRTVRRLPETAINYKEQTVFVHEYSRGALLLQPKITPLAGTDTGIKQEDVQQQALRGLKKGFAQWSYENSYAVSDADELFYVNFYPYRSKEGQVYVSSELYAHYDCHTPIYRQYETPATGSSIEAAFAQAAQQMLAEIQQQLVNSEQGDAMNFLTKKTALTAWEALNLPVLNAPERSATTINTAIQLPTAWELEGAVSPNAPLLTFNFPAPLRHYGGELKEITGNVLLKSATTLAAAQGQFVVNVSSLQMGEAEFDSYVKGTVLMVGQNPKATLTFQEVLGDDLNLQLGRLTTVQVKGKLTLLGKSSEVVASTQFEPLINKEGEPASASKYPVYGRGFDGVL